MRLQATAKEDSFHATIDVSLLLVTITAAKSGNPESSHLAIPQLQVGLARLRLIGRAVPKGGLPLAVPGSPRRAQGDQLGGQVGAQGAVRRVGGGQVWRREHGPEYGGMSNSVTKFWRFQFHICDHEVERSQTGQTEL